jgi:hypothetical protein
VDVLDLGDKGLFNVIYEFGKRNLHLLSSYLALNSIIYHLSNPWEKYKSIHPPKVFSFACFEGDYYAQVALENYKGVHPPRYSCFGLQNPGNYKGVHP